MKELWTKDEAEFHGKYYDFPPVISFPKPLQQPHPPIYVGAMTAGNVFRRVMTYGNGWMPWLYTPEQIRDGRAMLDKLAPEFGRDPRSIGVVAAPVTAEPDVVRQYEDAGADRIVVFLMPVVEPEMLAELEQIAAKIIGGRRVRRRDRNRPVLHDNAGPWLALGSASGHTDPISFLVGCVIMYVRDDGLGARIRVTWAICPGAFWRPYTRVGRGLRLPYPAVQTLPIRAARVAGDAGRSWTPCVVKTQLSGSPAWTVFAIASRSLWSCKSAGSFISGEPGPAAVRAPGRLTGRIATRFTTRIAATIRYKAKRIATDALSFSIISTR